ncbi:MAG: ATP-dependent sacrificial sulfur transferase LarE [Deltaproteobacteria bacterium]|nr:ATP-dependent sacrificial sulfur transferase LarE [Deltaproteobacteria bacterium]
MVNLLNYLSSLDGLAVAFSGGVDSTFLLAAAKQALLDRVLAITVSSSLIPAIEIRCAKDAAADLGVKHVCIDLGEITDPELLANPSDRCYICKNNVFSEIIGAARKHGISNVADGTNTDDLKDFRPGMKAIAELKVISPLAETGWNKAEIREQSRIMGLDTWNKPSSPCLATRIPYGMPITTASLSMIEQAEVVLAQNGFAQCRVRYFGHTAKIEVPENEISRLVSSEIRAHIIVELRKIGFLYVTLDLEGYGSGRLNRAIAETGSLEV